MLHIVKLCVGADTIEDLAAWQKGRLKSDPPLRHLTRSAPRRAAEILGQGSLYWVIGGAILVRQRIVDIRPDRKEDGTDAVALVLDPVLVPTSPRPMRPFQGWRYLEPADAPADRTARQAAVEAGMPAGLRRELAALGLL